MRTRTYFAAVFIIAIFAGLMSLIDHYQTNQDSEIIGLRGHDDVREAPQSKRCHRMDRPRRKGCQFRSERRQQLAFRKIKINTHRDVVLRQVSDPSLAGLQDTRSRKALRSYVYDDVLHLNDRHGGEEPGSTPLYVDVYELDAIHYNGSGDLRVREDLKARKFVISNCGVGNLFVEGLNVDELHVLNKGAGNIRVVGQADELDVKSFGAGSLNAYQLEADLVKVENKGSGNVMVHADEVIQASIMGSGDVKYRGRASKTILNKKFRSCHRSASGDFVSVR